MSPSHGMCMEAYLGKKEKIHIFVIYVFFFHDFKMFFNVFLHWI